MRVRRFVTVLGLIVAGAIGVAQPAQAASGPWLTTSPGGLHTCAINTGNSLYCWGYNERGQVGDGTAGPNRLAPTKIGTSGAWASVTTGGKHTCAITTGKSLYCWGDNEYGQVGDGTTDERSTPKKIGTSGAWASVAAGGSYSSSGQHTCAITTGKSLYCWGDNSSGQVGDGTVVQRLTPRKVGSSGVWASVTVGAIHTCALTAGKSLYCWGDNGFGRLGDGTTDERLTPKKIGTSGAWASVAAGESHNCAISTGKSLYCWGYNGVGPVGDGTLTERHTPKKIGASGVWSSVTPGGYHSCAISTGKSLYCWGWNEAGQIGDGTIGTDRLTPKKIGTSGVWAGVNGGGLHTCAITTGKSLYCWGENATGQVGDGTVIDRLTPKKIA